MKAIERLRELAGKATPKVWTTDPMFGVVQTEDGESVAKTYDFPNCNNAAFIAAANPAVVLALLDCIEAWEKVDADMREDDDCPCSVTHDEAIDAAREARAKLEAVLEGKA